MAIVDSDFEYINSLNDYLNEKNGIKYNINLFSNRETCMKYCKENRMNLILLDENIFNDIKNDLDKILVNKIAIFSEEEEIKGIAGYETIYKYQRIENLISNMINLVAEDENNNIEEITFKKKKNFKMIITSPVGRCGKSELCFNIAKNLVEYKTLVINLEEFSSDEEEITDSKKDNVSDLMLNYLMKKNKFNMILDTVIKSKMNIDYISSTENPIDLREISAETWMEFINEIIKIKQYDVVLLDLSSMVNDYFKLINESDMLVVPILKNDISTRKADKFIEFIKKLNVDNIHVNIRKVVMNDSSEKEKSIISIKNAVEKTLEED